MKAIIAGTLADVQGDRGDSYEFPCGCRFPIDKGRPWVNGHPALVYDIENVRLDCEATWDLFATGRTKGVFQLESPLGKQWSKRLKPRNIEHLAALMALLRPGVLKAVDELGVSMTELYCRRKNGEEEVDYPIPAIEAILEPTYGVMAYQETLLAIAKLIADFDLVENDELRKCVTGDTMFVSKTRGWITIHQLLADGYENDEFLIMDAEGRQSWKVIEKIWSTGLHDVACILTAGNRHLWATDNHEILTNHGWMPRSGLRVGDSLVVADEIDDGPGFKSGIDPVVRHDARLRSVETFDFTMDDDETPYIVANGLVIHNSVGKKDQKLIAEVGKRFVDKAVAKGIINREVAEALFDNMRKSGKYLFNKSHAVAYGMNCYRSAHWKTHFPLEFFTSYMYWAKDKQKPIDEIRHLINDAKHFGIEVSPPRFEGLAPHFHPDGEVQISFGLADVNGIGEKAVQRMREGIGAAEAVLGPRTTWSWYDFLTRFSSVCNRTIVVRMIEAGALRGYKLPRQRMLAELDAYLGLTDAERGEILKLGEPIHGTKDESDPILIDPARPCETLQDALGALLARVKGHTKGTKKKPGKAKYAVMERRREHVASILNLLANPPYKLTDTPHLVAKQEEQALGMPISVSHVDSADRTSANTTIEEFKAGKKEPRGGYVLAVVIQECNEREVKNGDNRGRKMASLVVGDETGVVEEVVCFPNAYDKCRYLLLRPSAVVAIRCKADYRNALQLIVEESWEI